MNMAANLQEHQLDRPIFIDEPLLPDVRKPFLDERLKGICEIAADTFDVALASIILHRPDEGWQVVSAGRLALQPLPAEISLSLQALASDQPLIVPDTRKRPDYYRTRSEPGWRMRFFAAIPFEVGGVKAAICLLDRATREMPQRCVLKLQNLAGIAAGLSLH